MKLSFNNFYYQYIDINECSSNPCKNGGTCKDLVNGYECTCVPGYDDIHCHNGINC
jgi:Notch-like protein